MEAQGLFIEPGRTTLIDATLIEAQASRRRSKSAQGPTDPDAAWGGAGGGECYGCKGRIGADADTQLIRRGVFTPANVNETQVAEALLRGDEAAAHADRAYDTAERRDLWGAMHVDCRILRRANRYHPLTEAERELNALWERARRKVEPIFGTFKRSYGYRATRYFNLERNRFEFYLKCIAFNLRKLVRLQAAA